MERLDWREIEFRGGIEIHQQLKTRKLFCECQPSIRNDPPPVTTKRRLHAVASELGEYDPAALHEAHRARTFYYESYYDSVCLVELDEEPPHPVNRYALEIVTQSALMLDARIVDEIQVMRKTVIDGSNTAGFQRTMLVATDGKVQTAEGEVILWYFCLEEDAARIIESSEREVNYRLDRLGIPLLEIVTGPVFISPRQGGEVADHLGRIVRSLNVRRGIGSIRQDINVSTRYGTRIEIKGLQRHRLVERIMDYEARRQVNLWRIAQELGERLTPFGPESMPERTADVTDLFRGTVVPPLRRRLEAGQRITALGLPGFRGLLGRELCPGKILGTELKEQVLTLGVTGVIHSDEDLGRYGFTKAELKGLRDCFDVGDEDAWLLFAAPEPVIRLCLDKLHLRIPACFEGVPKESRRSLPDGNSQYMRPLPGEARMYPETDIPPVPIRPEKIEAIRVRLPEILEYRFQRYAVSFGLPLHDLHKLEVFGEALTHGLEDLGLEPRFVFNALASHAVHVRRVTGVELPNDLLRAVFDAVAAGRLIPDAVPLVLARLAAGEELGRIIPDYSADGIDLDRMVRKTVKANGGVLEHPERFHILMGVLMTELRGRIRGREVAEALLRVL
jgi:glutamyl-tRNA(Gln) amidotransferase subunit E